MPIKAPSRIHVTVEADTEIPPSRMMSMTYPAAWLVLVIGISISIFAFLFVEKNIRNEAQLRFERQASDAHNKIQARIRSYFDIMYGLGSLFRTSDSVNHAQFHRFVNGLDLPRRFPGFRSINYAEHVLQKDKAKFEQKIRRDFSLVPAGHPQFRITPVGDRPEYHVISYLEPMIGNGPTFGRDLMGVDRIRAEAVEQMRDSGKLSSSGRLVVINTPGKPIVGMAMRLPVYKDGMPVDTPEQRRAAFIGSLGAGFNVDALLDDVLGDEQSSYLRFRIYDAGPMEKYSADQRHDNKDKLLFDSKSLPLTPDVDRDPDRNDFVTRLPLEMAGRILETHFAAEQRSIINKRDALSPYIVLLGGMLTSLLLFGIAYSLATSRRRAVALAARMTEDLRNNEKELRDYAERLKAVSRRLVEVQEAERRSLAGELHDRIGQNLTALGLNIGALRNAVTHQEAPAIDHRFEDSERLVQETIESMRDLMSELRPQGLDDYGLVAPLRVLAAEYSGRTNTIAAVVDKSNGQRLPRQVEVALFRIAQEALNNAAKYSRSTRADITLTDDGETAELSIKDDGIGFHVGQQERHEAHGGYGLQIMRERAEAIGADLHFESGPGMGTSVIVRYRRTLPSTVDE